MGRRLRHNVLWSSAVLAVVAGIGLGLPALDAAVPAAKPVPAGQPYHVSDLVTVVPPTGAELDVTRTAPGTGRGSALFLLRGVRYAVVVAPFDGSLDAATAQFRRIIAANRGYQVTGREVPVRTGQGVAGRQGGYASPGRDGRYAVFLADGTVVEVTFAGADVELHTVLPALEASVSSIVFWTAG